MAAPKKNYVLPFEVTIAGQTLTQKDPKGLSYLCIEDHLEMIGLAQLQFGVGELKWESFEPGDDVVVTVGDNARQMFKGHITGFRHTYGSSAPETFTILAMDPLVRMAASRNTKVWGDGETPEQLDSQIASDVIERSGCMAGKVDETGPLYKYVMQRNESDFNFLKRLAARNGYMLRANEGLIDFIKPEFGGPINFDSVREIISLDYTVDATMVPPFVSVVGWDYFAKEVVQGFGGSDELLLTGTGDDVACTNGDFWNEMAYVSDVLCMSQDAALEMAVGDINRHARRALRGRAVVAGNADVFAGQKVAFSKLGPRRNPEGLILSARHVIQSERGFTTEFQFIGNTWPV